MRFTLQCCWRHMIHIMAVLLAMSAPTVIACGQAASTGNPVRARDLGIPFDGTPGPLNAITDVNGVAVGHTTLIEGYGPLHVGQGPVRTGVTAVLPRGLGVTPPVFAAVYSLNGNGEMTGTHWVEESGLLDGPVMITNTHSVGVVRDAVIAWRVKNAPPDPEGYWWSLPVVAETYDGYLNDVNGFHVKPEHVTTTLENAHGGAVEEGSVGGGTGMVCHGFKGGIGTASRKVTVGAGKDALSYTVGVLVQCNYGVPYELRIAGVPVGHELATPGEWPAGAKQDSALAADGTLAAHGGSGAGSGVGSRAGRSEVAKDVGSIIVVVATDAPLLPNALRRLARRVPLGLGRNGSYSGDGSGDLFIAFSTANDNAGEISGVQNVKMLGHDDMDPLFLATVQATEEAVINALVAGRDMTGVNGHKVMGLPHGETTALMKKYGR